MNIELTPIEARIVGCLIEKEITTPDQYPLSLNALTNACNQKTNRDPVMELSEQHVQQSIDALIRKYLVSDRSAGYGGRVTKYKHRFCNTEFGTLKFSKQELGILCVLLVRGAQTPGELRARTNRLCDFADGGEVDAALKSLMEREEGPFVARLRRSPGERETRYTHLFSGAPEGVLGEEEIMAEHPVGNPVGSSVGNPVGNSVGRPIGPPTSSSLAERVGVLEKLVGDLRAELDALKR